MNTYQTYSSVAAACRALEENGITAHYKTVLFLLKKLGRTSVGEYMIRREEGQVIVELELMNPPVEVPVEPQPPLAQTVEMDSDFRRNDEAERGNDGTAHGTVIPAKAGIHLPQPLLTKEGTEGWLPTPCQPAQAKARNPYQPFFDAFPEEDISIKGVKGYATYRCLSYLQSLPEEAVVPVEALNFVQAYAMQDVLSEEILAVDRKKIAYQAYAQYLAKQGSKEECDATWFGLTLEDLGQQPLLPSPEKRGRKKQEIEVIPAINPHEKLVDTKQPTEAAMNIAQKAVLDMSEVLLKTGQLQGINFFKKVATVSELKLIDDIVKSKKYKGLPYITPEGKSETVSDLETFCQAFLGVSYRKVKEDLDNLSVFGEDFLESSQRLGLGYRDLKKLRSLPEEEREFIINSETVKVKDKDDLIELIEDMAAKHSKEKETAQKAITDLKQTLAAREKVSQTREDKNAKTIQELEEQVATLQVHYTPKYLENELTKKQAEALALTANEMLSHIGKLRVIINDIHDREVREFKEVSIEIDTLRTSGGAVVAQLIYALQLLQQEYHLEVPQTINTTWMATIETLLGQPSSTN